MTKEQLNRTADEFARLARQNMEDDGGLAPVALLIGTSGESRIIALPEDADGERRAQLIERCAGVMNAVSMVCVSDAWWAKVDSRAEAERTRPSDAPNRREAVIVTRATIGRVESAVFPYTRLAGGRIRWDYEMGFGEWVADEYNRIARWFTRRAS